MAVIKKTTQHITVRTANTAAALRDELAQVPDRARVVDVQIEDSSSFQAGLLSDLVVEFEIEVV